MKPRNIVALICALVASAAMADKLYIKSGSMLIGKAGTASTGEVKQLLGLKESIEGRTVIIVEDIIDSGLTMQELLKLLQKENPKDIRIAALLVKPGNLKVNLDIPYCCFKIPNDFIVGYGLDYNGEGRNLRSIYTVVPQD